MKKFFALLNIAAACLIAIGEVIIPIYINVTVGSGAEEFYSRVWKRLMEEKPSYVEILTEPSSEALFNFDLLLLDFDQNFEAVWKSKGKTIVDFKYDKDSLMPFKFFVQDVISIPLEAAAFKKFSIGDFGSSLRLTYNSGVDEYPSFSQDGRYLLFSSDRFTGSRDIYVLDIYNATLRKISIEGSSEYFPRLSPKGDFVVFQGSLAGNWGIFTIPFSGDKRAIRRIAGGVRAAYMPVWIDEKRIAYVMDRKDEGNELYIYDLESRISTAVNLPWDYVFSPCPAGDDSFFVTALDKADFSIYLVDTKGNYKAIENTRYNEHDPVLSPDGSILLFTSNRDGVYRVWAKDLKTGDEWAVTGNFEYDAFYPAFHPSGRFIAVSVYKPGWEPDIWIVRMK